MKYILVFLIVGVFFVGCSSQNGEKKNEVQKVEKSIQKSENNSSYSDGGSKNTDQAVKNSTSAKNEKYSPFKNGMLNEDFVQKMKDLAAK